MAMATQAVQRRQVYPAEKTSFKTKGDTKKILNDKNSFINCWLNKGLGTTPATVTVMRGGKLPGLHITYPVVVKSAKGSLFVVCEKEKQIASAIKKLRGAPFQVQQYLTGFTFLRLNLDFNPGRKMVEVFEERSVGGKVCYVPLESVNQQYLIARGAIRRLVETIHRFGVNQFSLTVAVRQQTGYIISCRTN